MQTITTLKFKDTRSGNSARGPWVLSIFEAGDGREYTTLKPEIAALAQSLGTEALLAVDYSERPAKAGKEEFGPSYDLTGVALAGEGAVAAPVAVSAATTGGKGEFRSPAQIIRTSALEFAVAAGVATGVDPVENTYAIIELATVFETFITEGVESVVAEA